MKKTGMRQCRADNVFDAVNLIICIILLLVFLYPLYFVVIASFSEPSAVWNGDVLLWPVGFCLDGYKKIMTYSDIITGYINSICYTVGSVALGLVLSFALSRVMGTQFSLSLGAIVLGTGFSAVVGIIFGWAPARKASRLNPIDALRSM